MQHNGQIHRKTTRSKGIKGTNKEIKENQKQNIVGDYKRANR